MAMSYIWAGMFLVAVVFAFLTDSTQQVSVASVEGATTAVELCLAMTGAICLWMGMMEVMRQCGLAEKLAGGLRPFLRRLYPDVAEDKAVLGDISANVSANLLGLGNAATPLGLQAVKGLRGYCPGNTASPSLCLFIVCNTASIQLLPTTVASLRSASGSENPLEILPAVWCSSLCSVTVGILVCKLLEKITQPSGGRRRQP